MHNEEVHNSYCLPSIIRTIKLRKIGWERHVARMGRRGKHICYWWESEKERRATRKTKTGGGDMDWIDLAQDKD
jgi:hypothetical protein